VSSDVGPYRSEHRRENKVSRKYLEVEENRELGYLTKRK